MSALNAFVGRDEVHVFTDAGVFDQDGRFLCLQAKVNLLAAMPGVIAATGPVSIAAGLGWVLGKENPATFTDLVAGLHSYVATAVDMLRKMNEVGLDTFEIVVAAWDEVQDRPRLVRGICVDGKIAVAESNVFRSPKLALADIPHYDIDRPRESGLALLEAQRRTLCGIAAISGSAAHVVGGVAHHTIVARDGVTTSIVRRWPDVVGRKISPAGARNG